MALNQRHVKLAQSLPPRLRRFFALYPPQAILEPASQTFTPSELDIATPNAPNPELNASIALTISDDTSRSPFKPYKNPMTGMWQDPAYSLRRQADLLKLARKHGVEELMPHSVKSMAERTRKRAEHGLRVKGTGVGQRVKGKESERTMKGRLEERRQAMLNMPQMIQKWKERGHGRGWKKWPK